MLHNRLRCATNKMFVTLAMVIICPRLIFAIIHNDFATESFHSKYHLEYNPVSSHAANNVNIGAENYSSLRRNKRSKQHLPLLRPKDPGNTKETPLRSALNQRNSTIVQDALVSPSVQLNSSETNRETTEISVNVSGDATKNDNATDENLKHIELNGKITNISSDLSFTENPKVVNPETNISSDIASIIESLVDQDTLKVESTNELINKRTRLHLGSILQREVNSPLQLLLNKKKYIDVKDKNKLADIQALKLSSTVSDNNATTNDKMILILNDIKNILQESESDGLKCSLDNLNTKYEALEKIIMNKVETVQSNLNMFTENTDQKMDLVLENMSTMKILVTAQSDQVLKNNVKIYELTDDVKSLKTSQTQMSDNMPSRSLLQPLDKFNGNLTDFNNKDMILNISRRVDSNQEAINSTFFSVTDHISKLETAFSSYEDKCNHHFLKNIPEHINLITNYSNGAQLHRENNDIFCSCDKDTVAKPVDSLRDRMTSQSETIENLQINTDSLQQNIEQMQNNISSLAYKPNELNSSNSSGPSTTNNGTVSDVHCSALSRRLSLLEQEVQLTRQLREQLDLLALQLAGLHKRTDVCVWPYRRTNDGCYFVGTDERLSWVAARGRCRELQGDLAHPSDMSVFRKFLGAQRLSRSYSFWVGGHYRYKERWSWIDGRPIEGDTTVWATGHPSLTRPGSCMEIRPELRLFSAAELCRVPNYFICQQGGTFLVSLQ